MALKSVSLNHVRYEIGDKLGHFLLWISLLPVFIDLGGFWTHFIFRGELQAIFFSLGIIISYFINELINKSIQQARHDTCVALEMCDSHGCPSSHSQYMAFVDVYLSLLVSKGIGISNKWSKIVTVSLTWLFTVLAMYSRVYLGYHTMAQLYA